MLVGGQGRGHVLVGGQGRGHGLGGQGKGHPMWMPVGGIRVQSVTASFEPLIKWNNKNPF